MKAKIEERIHNLCNMIDLYEHSLEHCMKCNAKEGIKNCETMIKHYQNEIDFLEELLEY